MMLPDPNDETMTTPAAHARSHWRLALIVIFLLALTLRLAFVFVAPQPENQVGDSVEFDLLARNLLAGHGLSYKEPWQPSARKTPLYPWLLAQTYRLFGQGNYTPLLTLQAFLDALLVIILAWLALWAWRDHRIGLVAAGLWAIYLPGAQLAGRLLADSLFIFLQLSGFLLFVLAVRYLADAKRVAIFGLLSGLLFGLASLTRPTSLYIPLLLVMVLGGWWLWRRRKRVQVAFPPSRVWLGAITMMLSLIIVVTPWFVRNYRAFDQVVMGSTLMGFNFFQTHYRLDQPDYWRLPGVQASMGAIRQAALDQGLDLETINEAELFNLGMARGLEMVKQYPGRFLALMGLRTLQLWFNLGFTWRPSVATLLFAAMNLGLLVLAGWAEWQAWRRRSLLFTFSMPLPGVIHVSALLILLYYTLSHAAIIAAGRYIIPAIPFLIILAAGAPWRWLPSHESDL